MDNYECIDFQSEIGFLKDDIWYFKDGCDSGDHLHPSKDAYNKMGNLAAKYIINELEK